MQVTKGVKRITSRLNESGHQAYLVGGCVRDYVMGLDPKDYDIATDATPEQVKDLFGRTVDVGAKYGTVLVIDHQTLEGYEVTTFRTDSKHTDDHRRPESVTFSGNLSDDLSRRDFTMNAMAYDLNYDVIIDPYNGQEAIKEEMIKCVGCAANRFEEDALRMLRAIRFACTLGFGLDFEILVAIQSQKHLLNWISKERIRDEFNKIMKSGLPCYGLELLRKTGLLFKIVPELEETFQFDQMNEHHDKDVYHHILAVIEETEPNLVLRLSALFHDIGKPKVFTIDNDGKGHFYQHHIESARITEHRMRKLKYDNETIESVALLVREHMSRIPHLRPASVKKFINRVGVDNLDALFKLQKADIMGHLHRDLSHLKNLESEVYGILEDGIPFSLKDLAINGYDLKLLGMKEGPNIGLLLNELLEEVLEDPELNMREPLLELAKNYLTNL